MLKTNYISKMSDSVRKLAIAALVPAMLVCAACFSLAVSIAILHAPGKVDAPLGPLTGCILIFGFLTFATAWMAIRLLRKERASNGQTVMPELFIQIFGMLFLIGIVAAAIVNKNIWLAGQGVGIAFAMIGIRSLIRREESL